MLRGFILACLALAASHSAFGNIYEELGFKRDAPHEEIKQSYRIMAAAFHPDKFPEGSADQKKAEETFKERKRQYDLLLDPDLRAKYDEWLDSGGYEEHLRQEQEEAELNRWRKERERRRQQEEERRRQEQKKAEERRRREEDREERQREAQLKKGTYLHRTLLAEYLSSEDFPYRSSYYSREYEVRYWRRQREIESAVLNILKHQRDLDINGQNSLGKTALHIASEKKYALAARALLKAGADPNIRDSSGLAPVHYVVISKFGPEDIERYLAWLALPFYIESEKVDFSLRTADGKTAVELAMNPAQESEIAKRILRYRGSGYLRPDEKERLSNWFIDAKDMEGFNLLRQPRLVFRAKGVDVDEKIARAISSKAFQRAGFSTLAGLSSLAPGLLYEYDSLPVFIAAALPAMAITAWAALKCAKTFKPL